MPDLVRQVLLTDEGPMLVSGPVDIVLPDGRHVRSDRPVTALCTCRRSRRQPFCDTSHRRKVRDDKGRDDEGRDDEGRAGREEDDRVRRQRQ